MSHEVNPFESPQVVSEPGEIHIETGGGARPVVPFASGHGRAMWTISLLAAGMVADLLGAGSTLLEVNLLNRAKSGEIITPVQAENNDARQALVGLCQAAVYLGSAIAFLMWFHRTHRNLRALGAKNLKYSPGWAVGAWFIPILNLFRPYQIMAEVWRGSDPMPLTTQSSYAGRGAVSPLLGWWWALWIIMNVVNQIAFRLSMHAETLDLLLPGSWATVVGDLIGLPAALLAIMVVRAVDANQQRRYRLLRRQGESSLEFPPGAEFFPTP